MVVMKEEINDAIFDSKELACYVCDSYFNIGIFQK